MTRITNLFYQLPIRWKITLWSSLVLFILFVTYNSIQYYVMRSWMIDQEERNIQDKMNEVQAYLADKPFLVDRTEIIYSSGFLEKVNEANELIRIIDRDGNLVLAVATNLPQELLVTPVESDNLEHVKVSGKHYLIHRQPVITNGFIGYIEIIRDLKNYERLRKLIFLVTWSAGAGAILLSGVGGMLIARKLLKPIAALTDTMKRIKKRGFKERVPQDSNERDEIADISNMFNEMMTDVETSFQKQKQFVEDASHELRTPISILEGHLSMLNRWGKNDPEVLEESLKASQQEVERLKMLVFELLELTRLESDRFEIGDDVISPVPVIEELLKKFTLLHPEFSFEFENRLKDDIKIQMADRHLEQLLIILLDNAVKYSMESRKVEMMAERKADKFIFHIKDYGIGIPKEDLEKIFNRFYRVDKARSREKGGQGLGLSIAKRIVHNYNGLIEADSKEGEWTLIHLQFDIEKHSE
ncbi:HAMP domain-containing histidine kinase [Bacillus tianshenii]|uniref:HAMP domain-containing sensor histidine kinase n=1 Tax=Sutcliffiella tianshenii TaxID=1463404 RepID=UPI001CD727E6|nr:HAMP domain-containing histidine kinase [Bacillus tianshenii]MCA1318593.1 HAMP domain-containing histidine kinase [Bacillus tianshenii]